MRLTIETPGKSSPREAKKVAAMLLGRGYINIEPLAEPAPKKSYQLESIPAALKRKHGRRA